MIKNAALLLVGIGVFLLGLAAMIYVIRGPRMTFQQQMVERILDRSYSQARSQTMKAKGKVSQPTPKAAETR